MHRQFRSLCRAVFLTPIALACFTLNLIAAESGIGIYLLGAKGPQAAVLPPTSHSLMRCVESPSAPMLR